MSEVTCALHAVLDVLRTAGLLTEVRGSEDVVVRGVSQDSRTTVKDDLFLAWKGTQDDAHDFVPGAVGRGASAVVVERPLQVDVPQLVVRDGRRAAALAADVVLGSPSARMAVVGVTGTNGKTTTSLLVRHLVSPETRSAVIGTLGLTLKDGVRAATEDLTTPGPVQLTEWMRDLSAKSYETVVIEASSHAIEQHRLDGISFDVAVFTNLSQDHLDYHGDMEAYRAAKLGLARLVSKDGTLIVNADDDAWEGLEGGGRKVVSYSLVRKADVRARDIRLSSTGTSFRMTVAGQDLNISLPLIGRYNVENALAASAAAIALGVSLECVAQRLEVAPQVAGRLEAVVAEPFGVLIDFAHTPAALEGALEAVRPLTEGRLIVLFGAGGDRDRSKRRLMAQAVARLADVAVLTSDNPRTEDPDRIIDDLVEGIGSTDFIRMTDRRDAIRKALEVARPGDTVVLAGKGHEKYQVVGKEKQPFLEADIARDALRELGVL